MPETLYQRRTLHRTALELLIADKRTLLEIHKQSGLPFYWLRKLRADAIPEPGVNRIQALYEFLTNTQLTLP